MTGDGNPLHTRPEDLADPLPKEPKSELGYAHRLIDLYGDRLRYVPAWRRWLVWDGKRWAHVNKGKPVPWGPRVLHYTVVHDDKVWVIGGQTIPALAAEKELFHRDIWNTTDGIRWTETFIPALTHAPRSPVLAERIWPPAST